MRRDLGILAGATAVAAAIVATTQSERFDPPPSETAAQPMPAAPAPPLNETTASVDFEAEIARLTTALAEREAELTRLRTELAARDTALDEQGATLAERDATLAERDVELRELRAELAALRERYAFELQLAAMKPDPAPARVEPARADAAAPSAALRADAGAPGPEPVLTAVHFESGSARLTPGGQAHCAAAAVMLGDMALARVRLVGHTDRVGDPERNRRLAEARARAVAEFLVAAGLDPTLIETAGMGEAGLPVATDDGVAEPLNRAVAIIAVPPSTG